MRMIEHLRISSRLLLIVVMLMLPLAVLFWFYAASILDSIDFANKEKQGNACQRPMEDLLRLLPQHALLVAQKGNARTVAREIDQAFEALLREDRAHGATLFSPASLAARQREHLAAARLAERWGRLKDRDGGGNSALNHTAHQELLDDVLTMISHVGDTSNLILDPDLDSYYLMDITLLALPQTQKRLADILDYGALHLAQSQMSSETRRRFAVHAAQLRQNDYDRVVITDTPAVLQNDAAFHGTSQSLHKRLPPAVATYAEANNRFINLLTTLADGEESTIPLAEFLHIGSQAREQSFLLWQVASQELDVLLDSRIAYNRQRGLVGSVLTLVSLLLSGLLVLFIVRSITRPLSHGVRALGALAIGDLNIQPPTSADTARDEISQLNTAVFRVTQSQRQLQDIVSAMARGNWDITVELRSERDSLGQALQVMIREVGQALGAVHKTARQIHGGAEQIAQSSATLSQQMTEQAASLQEISASVSEISSQADNNAGKAQETDQLVLHARQAAQSGTVRMGELTGAMEQISTGSQAISKIIKVIDEIAFQTNLLALNAAVEAARAGQHGRGFAVVADEVRNLAGRSARAARETSELIDASGGNVQEGVRIADQTSSALHEIVDTVARMADLVSEITVSSRDQAQQVTQIRMGLDQLNTVTQHNTVATEEVASVAEVFHDEAQQLKALLERFVLQADACPPEAAPHSRRAQHAIAMPGYNRTPGKNR